MLSESEVLEIRGHLECSQNPLFFFDNDQDGLCSFLLLRRYLGRGKGVAIKSFPTLDESYLRKVDELNADYVFVLDKPVVSKEFFDRLVGKNIPVVYIDHHDIEGYIPKEIFYYNPCKTRGSCVPVTRLCYQITGGKKDLWLAVIGCISDGHMPDFYKMFVENFPEMGSHTDDPFKVLYDSKIGEVARLFSHGLKDTTTNVVKMLKLLIEAQSPYDVLEESTKNFQLHRRAKFIQGKYDRILDKAKVLAKISGRLLFFRYSGDLSVSGEISNELKFLYPEKFICVCYLKGSKVNLSLRGKSVKDILLKVLEGFDCASGGGHMDAVGGQIQTQDLDEFKKRLEKELSV